MTAKEKFSVQINWSEEDECYIATSQELPHLSAFGDSYDEAIREMQDAMSGYLDALGNENLPEPFTIETYSGQFRVRLPRSLHRRLVAIAKHEGVSLNTLVVKALSESTSISEVSEQLLREVKANIYREMIEWVNESAKWAGKRSPLEANPLESTPPGSAEA